MAEISIKTTEKDEKTNKTKTITINFDDKSCESNGAPLDKAKFEIETVAFVATKLKEFFRKKGWFADPSVIKKGKSLCAMIENRCSMRDVLEDFRFFLRQHFANNREKVMPAFQYTTQTSLSEMATAMGFRVMKPQNRFTLRYYLAASASPN